MKRRAKGLVLLSAMLAVLGAGCGHKLVAKPGQHTVRIYTDEQAYQKLRQLESALKKQPNAFAGMVAGMGQQVMSRELPSETAIKIISQDTEGAVVEVADGPNKGMRGFVPSENLK